MEFVCEKFVYFIINMTSMTNFKCSFNIFFLCSLYTAFISEINRTSLYLIRVLWSIDVRVIHSVAIEIHIDVVFFCDFTNAGLRVILWDSILNLYFFTGKGELIIIVYVTVLIVGKAAASMLYFIRRIRTVGYYVLCLMICIFEESLETSR